MRAFFACVRQFDRIISAKLVSFFCHLQISFSLAFLRPGSSMERWTRSYLKTIDTYKRFWQHSFASASCSCLFIWIMYSPITSSTRFFTCLKLCDIALVISLRYVSINFYCVLLVIGKVVQNKSFISLYVFEGYVNFSGIPRLLLYPDCT